VRVHDLLWRQHAQQRAPVRRGAAVQKHGAAVLGEAAEQHAVVRNERGDGLLWRRATARVQRVR
jgi:hypothetical protein